MLRLSELEVVDRLFEARKMRERDADALPHEPRRLPGLLRRDEIERAALVRLSPAAPVRQLRFHLDDLLVGCLVRRLLRRRIRRDRRQPAARRRLRLAGRARADRPGDADRQHGDA